MEVADLVQFMKAPIVQFFARHSLTIAITLVAAIVLLWGLGAHPLKNWDEAIYAQVAKEMFTTGDWLTMRWDSMQWFEKPPLYIWMTTIFYHLFGVNEFSARLPSALGGIGLVTFTFLVGQKIYGKAVGLLAAVIVLTNFQIVQTSRLVVMDVLMTFFIFAAIYFYLRARDNNSHWWYAVAIAVALAFMTKNVPGLMSALAILLAELWDGRLKATIRQKDFWLAIGLGFVVIAPWHVAMYMMHGNVFVNEYLTYHVVSRGLRSLEGHKHDYFFYSRQLIWKFKPWWPLIPFAIFLAGAEKLFGKHSRSSVVLILSVLVFSAYTIARTQISWYINPVYPALSILIAYFLMRLYTARNWLKPVVVGFCIAGVWFAIGKLGQPYERTDPLDTPMKELSLLAKRTDPGDSEPLIIFGGPEIDQLTAMFYSERPVEQATTGDIKARQSRIGRYFHVKHIAEVTDHSPRRIILKKLDVSGLASEYEISVVAEAHGWVYGWVKKR